MSYEAFREQCAQIAESMPKFSTNGSVPLQDRIAEKIRALPLPEFSIQHKNMICMAECMDMVRSELIEMGIIDSSVPPMMIADAVGDKLKESTEALRKENERLREENKALLDTISMGLASSIKCNCGHLEKYRAEAKKVVDATLKGGAA